MRRVHTSCLRKNSMPNSPHDPIFIPIAQAAALSGMPETKLRQDGLAGKFMLRTVNAQLCVDVDALKQLGYIKAAAEGDAVCAVPGLIPSDIRERICGIAPTMPSAQGARVVRAEPLPVPLSQPALPRPVVQEVVAPVEIAPVPPAPEPEVHMPVEVPPEVAMPSPVPSAPAHVEEHIPEAVILHEVIIPKTPAQDTSRPVVSPIQPSSALTTVAAALVFMVMVSGVFWGFEHQDQIRVVVGEIQSQSAAVLQAWLPHTK